MVLEDDSSCQCLPYCLSLECQSMRQRISTSPPLGPPKASWTSEQSTIPPSLLRSRKDSRSFCFFFYPVFACAIVCFFVLQALVLLIVVTDIAITPSDSFVKHAFEIFNTLILSEDDFMAETEVRYSGYVGGVVVHLASTLISNEVCISGASDLHSSSSLLFLCFFIMSPFTVAQITNFPSYSTNIPVTFN